MEFNLTYAGPLLSSREAKGRSLHVHQIRKVFHRQLAELWRKHPTLVAYTEEERKTGKPMMKRFQENGFNWLPLATKTNGLTCSLDILMLRDGPPGCVLSDIDNRLKTIFDALRKADTPDELGVKADIGQQSPAVDEDPFFVLVEDDRLISHVSVTSETLLEPVPGVPRDNAVRLVIKSKIRPYKVTMGNLDFS